MSYQFRPLPLALHLQRLATGNDQPPTRNGDEEVAGFPHEEITTAVTIPLKKAFE